MSLPVQVCVRVRPLQPREGLGVLSHQQVISYTENSLLFAEGSKQRVFEFDRVFRSDSSQEEVYDQVGRKAVEGVLAGYNSSVFCYGATGTGKTFTCFSSGEKQSPLTNMFAGSVVNVHNSQGLAIRALYSLFDSLENCSFVCRCSCIEIYLETVSDLLNPGGPLQLREDLVKGVFVQGLTESTVYSAQEAEQLLLRALKSRQIAGTASNAQSSRSHCVFTVHLERKTQNEAEHILKSKLNIIDLAGSERISSGSIFQVNIKETAAINKSLSTLTQVVSALSSGEKFIPYRDSKLTYLLRDSLGGNAVTSFIATVSPAASAVSETISTLQFAQRAKNVVCRAIVNEEVAANVTLDALRRELKEVKCQLNDLKAVNLNKSGFGMPDSRETRLEILLAGSLQRETEANRRADENLRNAQHWEEQAKMNLEFAESSASLAKLPLKRSPSHSVQLPQFTPFAFGKVAPAEDNTELKLLRSMLENHPEKAQRLRLEKENFDLKEQIRKMKDKNNLETYHQAQRETQREMSRSQSKLTRNKSSRMLGVTQSKSIPKAPISNLKRFVDDPEVQFINESDHEYCSPKGSFTSQQSQEANDVLRTLLEHANKEIAFLVKSKSIPNYITRE